MSYVLALAGVVAFAQGLAFLGGDKTRLYGVVLAPAGILALGYGLALALAPGF